MKYLISSMKKSCLVIVSASLLLGSNPAMAALSLPDVPLFVSSVTEPPLILLTMGRDHKLFYEAYNDASDLNDDGQLDIGYKPVIDYYGYFDSFKCYVYDSSDNRFEPSSTTANKKCSGANEWSGDWLNYITTARMDALRKVLYGGYRSVDTASTTVLERTHVPQDAHSWGKEYNGITDEGYDITEYTPLVLPGTGKRHLFANTTLRTTGSGEPRLRVLTNTDYRVWEWLSIERPVAGTRCLHGGTGPNCVASGGGAFSIVPNSTTDGINGITRAVYRIDGTCTGGNPNCINPPINETQMDGIQAGTSIQANDKRGEGPITTINTQNGDAFGQTDNYFTLITGTLNVSITGTYQFGLDGDDALDFYIDTDSSGTFQSSEKVVDWYGGHGFSGSPSSHSGSIFLTAGSYNFRYRHTEATGGSGYQLFWIPADASGGGPNAMTDYFVRVQACVPGLLETNCKLYPDGNYKPTGILHRYGESDRMKFGLLTGSYAKNLSGGVLRKKMGTFTDEVNPNNGIFTNTVGIARTIDRFRELGFNTSYEHASNCGFIFRRDFNEGECRWWGNPIAEMMYEGLRYFAGKGSPTSAFNISSSGNDDATLGLPLPAWDDPYNTATGGANECAMPMQLVISDINPSYDTDQLPGVNSNFGSFSGDLTGLNVADIANNTITPNEPDVTGLRFIGQVGSTSDGAPSPKTVTGLGDIRGLAPEEPTKKGGYYSSSVAYYGATTDVNPAAEEQKVTTLAVAIASPLPKFEIPVAGQIVTLVPFAKSVGPDGTGQFNINPAQGQFQPTNTIVDFYVEIIANTNADNNDPTINGGRPFYKFQINYEDAQQGADHDMDAIVEYTIAVNADDTITIDLNSVYAAGGIIQHMGYVISGTTADNIYLEVRDWDTAEANDVDYFLDTPNTTDALPLASSRTFTPGGGGAGVATLLKDPLWYAAKWGGFVDDNDNDMPDQVSEWDSDGDGIPDNYFLVTNAGKLEEQLEATFNRITELVGASASSVAINSTVLRTTSRLYQARFSTVDWTGEVSAFTLNDDATINQEVWTATNMIPAHGSRNIFTTVNKSGTPTAIEFIDTDADLTSTVGSGSTALGSVLVNYIRGDQTNEIQNGGTLRDRDVLLADIVNSSPISVSTQNFAYNLLPAPEGTDYVTFMANKVNTFTGGNNKQFNIVYVGANDGMLHAFQDTEDTDPATAGQEVFAYVPSQLHDELFNLANPNYPHQFYVDATPHSSDAYINGAWRTMLVGALGNGGRALYALNITDPLNFDESDVMWEFDSDDNAELGHVLSSPAIVKLNNGQWGVVFGNGYNSASQRAQLFILNAADGTVIKVIDTEVGSGASPNGLAEPFLLDENGDLVLDTVYAGDLHGNMWKFNLKGANPNQWDVAYQQGGNPDPLYTALDDNGTPNDTSDDTPQPVTTRPSVASHPNGGFMVLFGTGKYIETTDTGVPANPQVQSFYGVRDNNDDVGSGQSLLQQQSILAEIDVVDGGGNVINKARVVSDTLVDYANKDGWYLDLVSPINGAEAERVISNPLVRFGRIIFTTFIPKGGCEQGGASTIMELDAISGARLENSVFDFNNDGVIDADDFVNYSGNQIPGSGIYIPATLASPAVISAEDASLEYKLTSGITGEVTTTKESTGGIFVGRQSWRQLR